MGILTWCKEKLFANDMLGSTAINDASMNIYYKELAIQSSVNIIANALVLSEFSTFKKGKKTRDRMYYLLNVSPNSNQNAVEFWTSAISKLVYYNECLIVMVKDQIFVADSFNHNENALIEDTYTDVVIRNYTLNDTFKESDVLYLKWNDSNVKAIVDGLYDDYGVLLNASIKNYKKASGTKLKIEIDSMYSQMEGQREKLESLINGQYKNFINSESGVLPVSKGMNVSEFGSASFSKDSRDIRHIVDDIIDLVAMALHVPAGIIKGDVVAIEQQTDNFLMFCLNPLAKLITSELNRKLYTQKEYLNRTFVKMDTFKIRMVDLEKAAKSADLLFRVGVNSINDNLELVGRETIKEEWADERYVTKNYSKLLSDYADEVEEKKAKAEQAKIVQPVEPPVEEEQVEEPVEPEEEVKEVEEPGTEPKEEEKSDFKKKYKVKTKRKK